MMAAIYARVSTKDQDCAVQLAELRAWCARHDWDIHNEYVDTGWRGQATSRPALDALMADARAAYFDAVVVSKLDRFGRSVIDLNQNIQELKELRIRFLAVSQGIDTNERSPSSKFMLQMLAAVAEFEVELIRERVKAGMEHAKKHGTRSGKRIGHPKRVFRIDELERLKAEGVPVREIARRLKIGLGTAQRACSTTPAQPLPLSDETKRHATARNSRPFN